jgi:chloramphenicol 3-O-phosphotransferase
MSFMSASIEPGQIVILNGPPRSGKSSIATAIQDRLPGVWLNLGVDRFKQMIPSRFQPGIGLRPGGERPDLEPLIVTLYHAMYESITAPARLGINVVAVHDPGVYDLDVDTALLRPEECVERIADRLNESPAPAAFFHQPAI